VEFWSGGQEGGMCWPGREVAAPLALGAPARRCLSRFMAVNVSKKYSLHGYIVASEAPRRRGFPRCCGSQTRAPGQGRNIQRPTSNSEDRFHGDVFSGGETRALYVRSEA